MTASIKEIKICVTKKTIDPYIYIPNFFAPYLVKLLLYTKITPNQISLLLYLMYIPASILIALNNHVVTGIILLHLAILFDCSDGVLARVKQKTSFLGEYFEYISHETIPAYIFLALSMYSYQILKTPISLYLGLILLTSILVIVSTGTSKQRMMYVHIKKTQKLPKKMVAGQLTKDSKGILKLAFDIFQVISSLGVLTALITIAYIFNFMQYLIFFYVFYFLAIAIYKFIYELKTGFKPWGLK